MKVTILSIFPQMVESVLNCSMIKRAGEKGLLDAEALDIRDFAEGKHRVVDDYQYGGGAGMVMKPEPLFKAVESVAAKENELRVIMTSPQGIVFNQKMAQEFSEDKRRLVFICGHYEGIDERVITGLGRSANIQLDEVSIGDFVMTGGELAALVMLDASIRLVPGVLGNERSLDEESFSTDLLDFPKYTRPATYKGMEVPAVLLSGNHKEIDKWRNEMATQNTRRKRPDLL